ncbi:hypothetical protein HN903_02530 [archaeon]|jgi:hypothetical protein|nr:hypothetical protein [archaeon]MBT7128608.1 hypothetical protein [archaeon]
MFIFTLCLATVIYLVVFNIILKPKIISLPGDSTLDFGSQKSGNQANPNLRLILKFFISLILLISALFIVFFPSANLSPEVEKLASGIIGAIVSSWISR